MKANNQPLVSIPVITYNSAKYVIETLESIKAQTYQNIELIVSDDCSTDNTIELCQKWIEQNKKRFVRTNLITSKENTGVSANLNRAEGKCIGEWVKIVDGDDVLLPNCVELFVNYIQNNPNEYFIFAKMICFDGKKNLPDYLHDWLDLSFYCLSSSEQYKRLVLKGNCLPCPTYFYNMGYSRRLGINNDESIPMCEDYPKWVNITKKGQKLFFMNQTVVKYRVHPDSITHQESSMFKESSALVFLKYRFKDQFNDTPIITLFRFFCVKYYLTKKYRYIILVNILKMINKITMKFFDNKIVDYTYQRRYLIKKNN